MGGSLPPAKIFNLLPANRAGALHFPHAPAERAKGKVSLSRFDKNEKDNKSKRKKKYIFHHSFLLQNY